MPWNLDPLSLLETFYSEYGKRVKPLGQPNPEVSVSRLVDPELDKIVDELREIPPTDPRAEELAHEGIKRLMEDLPVIPLIETIYEIVYTTKYWTNWPVPGNEYTIPPNWWPEFKFMLFKIRKPKKIEYANVWITAEVAAFTGADGKRYGPFREGEYVRLPKEDAERLIEEGKASYTPPVAPEIKEMAKAVPTLVSEVSSLSEKVDTLTSKLDALTSQVGALSGMLTGVIALEVIVLLLLIVAIALTMRRKA